MKELFLIRHAKSDWDAPWESDHERPLSHRGLDAAPMMGQRLAQMKISPELILSSTAVRAKHTAELMAKELAYPLEKISLDPQLYHASFRTLLHAIQKQPKEIHCLFLIGHNPGLNDLIHHLGVNLDNLPTAGVCRFQLSGPAWHDADKGNVLLLSIDYPKKTR